MFSEQLLSLAREVLEAARARGLKIATAESCTGGLIAGLLTEIPGSSDVFERGFVTYSNEAKEEMLGVPHDLLAAHGAVSSEVAGAMARGALAHSLAHIAVAVTGIAGPGGGSADKPVGLVWIAVGSRADLAKNGLLERAGQTVKCQFGDIGRTGVRLETVSTALEILKQWFLQ
jgi:nicotinamide-nucleotide amidase